MRILLVTHYYAPEVGAPQHRWDALVARFVAAGHQVAVLAPSPHYPSGRAGALAASERPGAVARGRHGELVHRLRFGEYGTGVSSRARDQLVAAADAVRVGLTRFAGARRPDVVVATAPGLPTIPAGLVLARALRRPLVLEMRDAWPDLLGSHREWDTQEKGPLSRLAAAVLPGAVTAAQRRADAVVTTTAGFAEVLRGRGLRRVRVVRNGAGVPDPARPGQVPHARAGRELRVLYLGTIGRSQGLGTAVDAVATATRAGADVHLRIVGDGAEVPALRARAAGAVRAGARVDVLPPVPRHAVAEHYAWADTVLVSLRAWRPLCWTVPSKLYEALATGRHVSGVLAGEAAGVVSTAGAGHVVDPGDAAGLAALWGRLHADRSLLDVGAAGQEWVRRHADPDRLAADYLALLAEVTRGRA